MSQENAAAGIFGQDDGENFEQITESARGGVVSQTRDFNYAMGLGHEGEIHEEGYPPGHLGPTIRSRTTATSIATGSNS